MTKKDKPLKIELPYEDALQAFMRTPPPKLKVEIVPLKAIPLEVIKAAEIIKATKKPKKKPKKKAGK